MCLAYFESKFNPSAVYENSEEGYTGFGLFQIRDSEWCDHGRNLCNLSCSGGSLLPGALEAAEPTHLEKAGGGNWPGLCFMLVPGRYGPWQGDDEKTHASLGRKNGGNQGQRDPEGAGVTAVLGAGASSRDRAAWEWERLLLLVSRHPCFTYPPRTGPKPLPWQSEVVAGRRQSLASLEGACLPLLKGSKNL